MADEHEQLESHKYFVHYPAHEPRENDPHYKDFNAYHNKTRPTARCFVGEKIGFQDCKDPQGKYCIIDENGKQSGLELHHTHIEFALQNGVDLSALEKDYPGISNPDEVGGWVESAINLRWLCTWHHRGLAGAHTLSHADWEANQYIPNMIEDKKP